MALKKPSKENRSSLLQIEAKSPEAVRPGALSSQSCPVVEPVCGFPPPPLLGRRLRGRLRFSPVSGAGFPQAFSRLSTAPGLLLRPGLPLFASEWLLLLLGLATSRARAAPPLLGTPAAPAAPVGTAAVPTPAVSAGGMLRPHALILRRLAVEHRLQCGCQRGGRPLQIRDLLRLLRLSQLGQLLQGGST